MRTQLLLSVAVIAVTACDHSSSGSATPSGSASAAASASASSAPPAGSAAADSAAPAGDGAPGYGLGDPPRLSDADIEGLEKSLACTPATAAKPGPCKVLAAMEKCADWSAVAPSGDGRYIGHGFQYAGTATTGVVTILRSRTVPQTDVKPWQLPVKVAIDAIGKEAGPAFLSSDKAIAAFARHDVAPPKSPTIDFLKAKTEWKDEAPAAKTMGAMVELFSERPTYVCQGPSKQIEIVRQDGSDVGVKPDGLYAELWPASW